MREILMKYVIADVHTFKDNPYIFAKAYTFLNARKKCYKLAMNEKGLQYRTMFGIYEVKNGTYDLKGIVSYEKAWKNHEYNWYVIYRTYNRTKGTGKYTYQLYPDGEIKRITG